MREQSLFLLACMGFAQIASSTLAQDVEWRVNSLLHPQLFGESARIFADEVQVRTGGAFKISVEDQVVLDVDAFEALRTGLVDGVWGSPGHHHREDPALTLFGGFPFGPGPRRMTEWMTNGGGSEALETVYARHGLRSIYCGALPAEGGGWFRTPVEGPEDLNGLAVRSFGYGARTLEGLGVTTYELPAVDIGPAFETGLIDGAEFAMPSIDALLGIETLAPNLYLPGWQQPSTSLELLVSERTWLELPEAFRIAVIDGCERTLRWSLGAAADRQSATLNEFRLRGVDIRTWPDPVLAALERSWAGVIGSEAALDPEIAAVWEGYLRFETNTPKKSDD